MTLAKARASAEDLKEKAKAGINLAKARARKQSPRVYSRTFESVAMAWLDSKTPEWRAIRIVGNVKQSCGMIEKFASILSDASLFPVAEITGQRQSVSSHLTAYSTAHISQVYEPVSLPGLSLLHVKNAVVACID